MTDEDIPDLMVKVYRGFRDKKQRRYYFIGSENILKMLRCLWQRKVAAPVDISLDVKADNYGMRINYHLQLPRPMYMMLAQGLNDACVIVMNFPRNTIAVAGQSGYDVVHHTADFYFSNKDDAVKFALAFA